MLDLEHEVRMLRDELKFFSLMTGFKPHFARYARQWPTSPPDVEYHAFMSMHRVVELGVSDAAQAIGLALLLGMQASYRDNGLEDASFGKVFEVANYLATNYGESKDMREQWDRRHLRGAEECCYILELAELYCRAQQTFADI